VRARFDEVGARSIHVSLSHDAGIASAVVVLES
jgi:holo-[acyl-carrier protein] synthase